jgi:hypothetical protein
VKPAGWALAIVLISPVAAKEVVVKSALPVYEVTLPAGYQATIPPETPVRYVRSSGPEPWAKISLLLSPASDALKQDPSGVKVEQILPFLSLPPDCKYTFSTLPWHDLSIGVIEYHTVLKDLPIISRTALLPLQGKALIVTVYAPDPLEKEMREDFSLVIYRLTKTVTNWCTTEELGKIDAFEKVGVIALIVSALYPLAWVLLFRGNPMRFHWLRTGWLVTNSILLFIPFSSPGETSMLINPLVNGIMPLALLSFAVRRIKMGLES